MSEALAKRSRNSTQVKKCELAMGGQTDSQVHANSTQVAKSRFSAALHARLRKTIPFPVLDNTEANLRRFALGGQTVKNLRSLA